MKPMKAAAVLLLALVVGTLLSACPATHGAAPMPPDASDAARVGDTAIPSPPAVPPVAACITACSVMGGLGCAYGNALSCPSTMTKVDADHSVLGGNGHAVTCSGCASAKTSADLAALCPNCSP